MDAYTEPYPRFAGDGSNRAGFISGRSVLEVVSIQGEWVQVARDHELVGWVKGSQLIPPIGAASPTPVPVVTAPLSVPASPYIVVAPRQSGNGFAVAALTLGVIGIVLALESPFGSIIGIACAALGFIFGLLGLRNVNRDGAGLAGLAIAGVILGAVALVISGYQIWNYYRLTSTVNHALASQAAVPTVDANTRLNNVRITTCEPVGTAKHPGAAGTLLNTSGKREDFRVTVEFHEADKIGAVGFATTGPVDPGKRASWFAEDTVRSFTPTTCTIISMP